VVHAKYRFALRQQVPRDMHADKTGHTSEENHRRLEEPKKELPSSLAGKTRRRPTSNKHRIHAAGRTHTGSHRIYYRLTHACAHNKIEFSFPVREVR
jgi:hypothetical protein